MDFQWDELINLTYDMMFVIDNKGSIYFANQAATDNLYYTNEEFLSMNLSQILFESDKFIEVLELIISNSENQGENRLTDKDIDFNLIKKEIGYQDLILISKDTNLKIIMANFQVRRINKNNNEYFLLILRDVTERRYLEQELFKITENLEQLVQEKTLELQKKNQMLEKLATTDTLTSLVNIRRFKEILAIEIERMTRERKDDSSQTFAVIMCDADHFKYYNDTFGHQIGDEVIKAVGRILTESTRRIDTVARYGGDEFILLLPDATYQGATKTCFRIQKAIRETLDIKKYIKEILGLDEVEIPPEHKISLSMGVTKFVKGKVSDTIISEADNALYQSKEGGRDCIHVYKDGVFHRVDDGQLESSIFANI
ncbi:MAG: diguanylate cyclase [Spirochaetales bacterium]|nr:diguanylate cyclase [Spirochaetales bacterium]